jgi:F0F1-type ATP synthase assembly protein I
MQEKDEQNRLLKAINDKINKMAKDMEDTTIADYIQLLNSPRKLMWTNFVAGISRGVGFAIGFTIIASTIVVLLQVLIDWNLPIVGHFIARIVEHVNEQLKNGH